MKRIITLLSLVIGMLVFVFVNQNNVIPKAIKKTSKTYSQRKGYVKGDLKQDSPNMFAEYFKEIKTETGSTTDKYPGNYLVVERNRALKSKTLSKKLDNLWVSRGPGNVGGRSRGIIIDPDDATAKTWFIAAVGGGVWKTTDAGVSWEELTSEKGNLSASYMAMAPSNHNVIYVGTGEGFGNLDALGGQGVWKSVDKGSNWAQLSRTVDRDFGIINRIIVDPNDADILLASTSISYNDISNLNKSGIWKSLDGGITWLKKYSNQGAVQQIICSPNDFSIQYATVNGLGVIKSIDSGETWNTISSNQMPNGRIELAISPEDPTRIYASTVGPATDPPSDSELYITSDSGTSWTKLTVSQNLLGGQGWYDNAIIVSPYDKDIVFVAGVHIYKVKYNGGSLTRVTTLTNNYGSNEELHKGTHVDNHFFAVSKLDDSNKIFRLVGTNDGGVCYTDDEGVTFKQPITGFVTSQFYGVDKSNGKDVYIGGMQDNSCFASPLDPSSGDSWTNIHGGDGFDVVWNYHDDNKSMFSSQYNIIAVTHQGFNNINQTGWLADVDRGDRNNAPFFTKLAQSKYYSDLVLTFGASGVWRTEDFGTTWDNVKMSSSYKGLRSTTEIKISLAAPEIVWTGGSLTFDNPMYVSKDFGKSFSQVSLSNLAKSSLSGFTTHPIDMNTAYALFSTYGNPKILKTTDYGQTWADISGFDGNAGTSDRDFPDVAVFDLLVMPYDPSIIWVGTEIGLFESTDDGATWHYANNNLPPVSIYDLLIVNDEVVIGTHGRGVWTVSLPELVGYEPPLADAPVELEASYVFENGLQSSDVKLKYRSNYSTIEVYVNDNLIQEYTDVLVGGTQELKLDIGSGENVIKVIGETGDKILETTKTIVGLPLKTASKIFASDFNNMNSITDEFSGNGFSISTPTGFDDNAINTVHPYAAETTYYLYLNTPIIVNIDEPSVKYKDVAIVEPGENGIVYPGEEFWDYVTIQGSTDGITWVNMVTPYDANFNAGWLSKYNEPSNPDKANYINHTFNTTDFFNDGDVILVRFKLFSDAAATSWGWIIDDLLIQTDALSLEDNFLSTQFKVYPNPVADEILYLESTTDSKVINVKIYNLSGQVLINNNFDKVDKVKLDVSNFTKGQYLLKVETDKGAFSKKVLVE